MFRLFQVNGKEAKKRTIEGAERATDERTEIKRKTQTTIHQREDTATLRRISSHDDFRVCLLR